MIGMNREEELMKGDEWLTGMIDNDERGWSEWWTGTLNMIWKEEERQGKVSWTMIGMESEEVDSWRGENQRWWEIEDGDGQRMKMFFLWLQYHVDFEESFRVNPLIYSKPSYIFTYKSPGLDLFVQ